MESSTVAIKVTHSTTTRRLQLARSPPPSYSSLINLVLSRFSLASSPSVHLSCTDDDGDVITISSDEELAELFAALAPTTTTIRFTLHTESDSDKGHVAESSVAESTKESSKSEGSSEDARGRRTPFIDLTQSVVEAHNSSENSRGQLVHPDSEDEIEYVDEEQGWTAVDPSSPESASSETFTVPAASLASPAEVSVEKPAPKAVEEDVDDPAEPSLATPADLAASLAASELPASPSPASPSSYFPDELPTASSASPAGSLPFAAVPSAFSHFLSSTLTQRGSSLSSLLSHPDSALTRLTSLASSLPSSLPAAASAAAAGENPLPLFASAFAAAAKEVAEGVRAEAKEVREEFERLRRECDREGERFARDVKAMVGIGKEEEGKESEQEEEEEEEQEQEQKEEEAEAVETLSAEEVAKAEQWKEELAIYNELEDHLRDTIVKSDARALSFEKDATSHKAGYDLDDDDDLDEMPSLVDAHGHACPVVNGSGEEVTAGPVSSVVKSVVYFKDNVRESDLSEILQEVGRTSAGDKTPSLASRSGVEEDTAAAVAHPFEDPASYDSDDDAMPPLTTAPAIPRSTPPTPGTVSPSPSPASSFTPSAAYVTQLRSHHTRLQAEQARLAHLAAKEARKRERAQRRQAKEERRVEKEMKRAEKEKRREEKEKERERRKEARKEEQESLKEEEAAEDAVITAAAGPCNASLASSTPMPGAFSPSPRSLPTLTRAPRPYTSSSASPPSPPHSPLDPSAPILLTSFLLLCRDTLALDIDREDVRKQLTGIWCEGNGGRCGGGVEELVERAVEGLL